MSVTALTGCSNSNTENPAPVSAEETSVSTEAAISEEKPAADPNLLVISEQGIFSAGGITVTSDGVFNPENQWEETGAGQTAHVDHANVLYQIPEDETGLPMVFLHGTVSQEWAG